MTVICTATITMPPMGVPPSLKPAPAQPDLFDQAVKVTPLTSSMLVSDLQSLIDVHASYATAIVYAAKLHPAFGNTPTMPNGGHVGSVILNACLAHQGSTTAKDPLSITFDYLAPTNMGQTFIIVRNDSRAGGRMHDVYADVYQLQAKGKDAPTSLVQTVRSVSLFGTFSTKGPSAFDRGHYGDHLSLEHTPVPHPKSWYLPPKICMLSHQFDLLVDLETKRRPRADYWVRHHPLGLGHQQYGTAATSDGQQQTGQTALNSTMPLHTTTARRIDLVTLPTMADFRRPAMENVLKDDAASVFDEPTRKWAYPTLSLTLRFFGPATGDEWMHVAWREHAVHGRVTSDFKMENEAGEVVCVGCMDSVMMPFGWFKG